MNLGVRELYGWAEKQANMAQVPVESAGYLACVASWRSAWRPKRVRVLLVAESHVAEMPGDASVKIDLPAWCPPGFPPCYCRLVYCLGYGENEVCSPIPRPNFGTWQYWDIFGQLARGKGHLQPRKRQTSLAERLQWKLGTLKRLREKGVWLVDASIVAVVSPSQGRLYRGNTYRLMLRESWSHLVWPTIEHEPLEQVWVIGKRVGEALFGLPGIDPSRVIPQPQDRNVARYQSGLARLIAAADASQPGTDAVPSPILEAD